MPSPCRCRSWPTHEVAPGDGAGRPNFPNHLLGRVRRRRAGDPYDAAQAGVTWAQLHPAEPARRPI
jgi:hypothetical protein